MKKLDSILSAYRRQIFIFISRTKLSDWASACASKASSNDELRAQCKKYFFNRIDRHEFICLDIGTNPKRDFPIVSLILSSTVFNGIIFFLLPSKIAPLTKSYIVSTIHAIVAVLSVSFYCARSTINLRQVNRIIGGGIAGTYDELMPYSLCYSCGYFLYDLLIMLMYKSVRSGSALIHHITIFSGIIVGRCHHSLANMFFLRNPCRNLHWHRS